MVVMHPVLAEYRRKKAVRNKQYAKRRKSDALFQERIRNEARERMQRLRASPEKRQEIATRRKQLRNLLKNADREREKKARSRAMEKARRTQDPAYREQCNRKSREGQARRRQDEAYRERWNAWRRQRRRDRIQADPEYGKRLVGQALAYKKAHPDKQRASRQRYRENPRNRYRDALRKAANRAIKTGQKKFRSSVYLGIALRGAKRHVESMLRPEWTWENYGKVWEIDHIYPIAKANINDPIELFAVSNYRNLRPLSPAENRKKRDNVTAEALLLFEELKREAAATLAADPVPA
jgi:hypothetical protein